MPESEAPPERTSSFRRMLELERVYMIERLQSKKSPEDSIPDDLKPNTSSPLSQAENLIRRASGQDGDAPIKPKSSITVNAAAAIGPRSQGDLAALDDATTAVATPVDKTSPRAAPRRASAKEGDDRSICVSPSWESHGRRRKEKKMMEKRDKEEAARAAAHAKARRAGRLSKQPPPASSTEALRKAETAPDPAASRGRGKDRSKSASAATAPPVREGDLTPRKARSRSSSFASLIRAPLSFRRSSVDKSAEPEFVGGIKLELERHLANEKILEQQLKAEEGVVHPAFRHGSTSRSRDRWPAPLNSHPPMGPSHAPPRDPSRTSYPPITRQDRSYRGRSMVPPTAPATPDAGKLDQWRARVGFVPSPQSSAATTAEPDMHPDDESDFVGRSSHAPSNEDGIFEDDDDISPTQSRHRTPVAAPGSRRSSKPAGLSIFPPQSRRSSAMNGGTADGRDLGPSEPRRQSSEGQVAGYRTAPSTPPEPPRRSPKRSPRANMDAALPPLPYHAEAAEDYGSSVDAMSPHELRSATPRTVKRMTVKPATQVVSQAASRQGRKRSSTPVRKMSDSARKRSSTAQPKERPEMPSDDSGSEEFHSPSVPSTPATSRSESDKGLPPSGIKAKHLSMDSTATDSGSSAAAPALATQDRGIHEIQAAADKVLASYREATGGGRSAGPRRESEPAVASGRSFLPVPVQQPLKLRDKAGRASVATTTPASQPRKQALARDASPLPAAAYLEEARRVPLGGLPARAAKPRLGPPASFTLPGDEALAEAMMTRPSLSQQEREPVAKVFVECCFCRFYHDMPSNLYEAMANPEAALSGRDTMEYGSAISMTVKCPWCRHEMSTRCCAGLAAMVFVTERLH